MSKGSRSDPYHEASKPASSWAATDKQNCDQEDGLGRAITEGLAGVYEVHKLLGSGEDKIPPWPSPVPTLLQRGKQGTVLYKALIGMLAGIAVFVPGAEGNTWQVQDVTTGLHWAIKLIKLPLPTKFVQAIFRCSADAAWS